MNSVLRRALPLTALSVLLAGCGHVPFGHHADVTKTSRSNHAEPDPGRRVAEAEHKATARDKRAPAPSAMDDAREQSALDPTQPYWPFHLAELELAADSVAAGESQLRAALARDPDYAPALALLSKRLYDTRRHEEAATLLEASRARHAARGDAMPADLLAGLALHLEALDRHDEARAALAAAPNPDRAAARGALIYLLLRGDHPDSASDLAAAAVDDDPKSAVLQNDYGITRLRAGDPAAAKKAFLKAVDLDPSLPGPYYNLAILEKFYRFDDAAAARWFDAYRRRGRTDPDSLGQVFAKQDAAEGRER
jgi:Tfp pilus assembly protein PilF